MNKQNEYLLQDVRVEFPNNAYPTQLAMMEHVVKSLKLHQKALLESPTGTGKFSSSGD
jgi:Fanconi anemia group J protein